MRTLFATYNLDSNCNPRTVTAILSTTEIGTSAVSPDANSYFNPYFNAANNPDHFHLADLAYIQGR